VSYSKAALAEVNLLLTSSGAILEKQMGRTSAMFAVACEVVDEARVSTIQRECCHSNASPPTMHDSRGL